MISDKVMIPTQVLRIGLAALVLLVIGSAPMVRAWDGATVEDYIAEAQKALRHWHYSQAAGILESGLKQFPGNPRLEIELGRTYLYQRRDKQAIDVFDAVLREEPANREAKLELGRSLSYQRKYEPSNRLFRELLTVDPGDEPAAIGLARNLLLQQKKEEARREVEQALTRHPNSLRLQEYRDDLDKNQMPRANTDERSELGVFAAEGSYFSDNAGNRVWDAGQRLNLQLGRSLSNTSRLDERVLSASQEDTATVLSLNDDGRVRLTSWLVLDAGGGMVRFADDSNRALYHANFSLHPIRNFWMQGGVSRTPITPAFKAAQFDLLAEGWWTRLNLQPRSWRVSADFAKQHYSDSNRTQREDAEVLRWLGNAHFALGLGYGYSHSLFAQSPQHGYFSPNHYRNHLALGGVRIGAGNFYRGEFIAQYGAESVDTNPYQLAWQGAVKNRISLRKAEIGADYTYFHLAQSTGAFSAQVGRVSLAYAF